MSTAGASALNHARTPVHSANPRFTLSTVGVVAIIAVIPVMQGGLVTATLPVLSLLAGLAFLAECRRFLFEDKAAWKEAAPWIYLWLGVSAYIFVQPAVRELLGLRLTVGGIDFTRTYWLQHVKYWSFFTAYWLLAWTVSRQNRFPKDAIILAVIAMALFEALYGTIAFVNGQQTILGIWPKKSFGSSVTGTFYNRDHLAGFFGVAMPLGAAYLMSWRWSLNMRHLPIVKLCAAIFFLLVTGAALIGTASRLGIFSALVGLFLWAWLHARSEHGGAHWSRIWLIGLVLLPAFAGVWFGPQHLIERLFQLDESTARLRIWGAMLDVPIKVWVQGIGAGSFADVFKLIQPLGYDKSVWRAHSEYLQFAFEFGLVGIALLAPLAIYWLRKCRPPELDTLQRGALAGVVAVMIHNIADFDMQVPGTAVMFWVALGILCSHATRSRRSTAPS